MAYVPIIFGCIEGVSRMRMHARVLLACNACCNVGSIGIMDGYNVAAIRENEPSREFLGVKCPKEGPA